MGLLSKLFGSRNRDKAEKLLKEGFIHAKRGRPREAASAYARSAQADDSFAHAWLNLGLARMDLYNEEAERLADGEHSGRLQEIADPLEKALELDGELVVGWRSLGHVSRRLGQYARAVQCFERVLEVAPRDFEHRGEAKKIVDALAEKASRERTLSTITRLAGDFDAAPAQLTKALEEAALYLEEAETPQSSAPATSRPKAAARNPGPLGGPDETRPEPPDPLTPTERWAIGVILRRVHDPERAQRVLESILVDEPQHMGALRDLATLALDAGELELALKHSMAAYKLDPTNAALVCNVGVCHLTMGDLSQAGEFLHMAKGLAPKDAIVQRAWSEYQSRSGVR